MPLHPRRISLSPSVRRLLLRAALLVSTVLLIRTLFSSSPSNDEIQSLGVTERVLSMTGEQLDVHKYPFLQRRVGRDERPDMFDDEIADGIMDFWNSVQKPFITRKETAPIDTQIMRGVIDELLQFHGWVAAKCPTLVRPYGQKNDNYDDIAGQDHLYYIALVVHSADHFLVDQLAIIVQLARRLGTRSIFVSMLDQGSSDATETLSDLCEAVLTILGIAFRISRVPPLTIDYYPLEEAEVRNLVLEPLHDLWDKRSIKFHRVIWLKGFTCPMDVLESLRVSEQNGAAMVCGMDWAEHNGFFIFSDRWRTRDIAGDLFRQARSSSNPEAGPPRDQIGTERYAQHLPFQVFCCESGTHVVDPSQSYYKGISYRASHNAIDITAADADTTPDPDTACMDSAQMWFCRDLWVDSAKTDASSARGAAHRHRGHHRRAIPVEEVARNVEAEAKLGKRAEPAAAAAPAAEKPKAAAPKAAAPPAAEKPKAAAAKAAAPKAAAPPAADKPKAAAPKAADAKAAVPKDAEPKQEVKAKAGDVQKAAPVKEDAVANAKGVGMVDPEDPAAQPANADNAKAKGGSPDLAAAEEDSGTNIDAMDEDTAGPEAIVPEDQWLIPNSEFTPARILVNPRCITTYGGVSHTQLAVDLFGDRSGMRTHHGSQTYLLEDWAGAPDSFVCQEMRTTGGRTARKSQRRVSFLLQNEIGL